MCAILLRSLHYNLDENKNEIFLRMAITMGKLVGEMSPCSAEICRPFVMWAMEVGRTAQLHVIGAAVGTRVGLRESAVGLCLELRLDETISKLTQVKKKSGKGWTELWKGFNFFKRPSMSLCETKLMWISFVSIRYTYRYFTHATYAL